jgi:hypothetical protein
MRDNRFYRLAELAFPGILVGLIAGVTAGSLALLVGQPPSWALVTAMTLGVPLAVAGGGFGLLAAFGKVRMGGFAPAALYWLIAFPVARMLHEVLTRLVLTGKAGLPPDPLGFLAFQGIISAGFAIGFLWLHERVAPRWWHKVAPHNEQAGIVFARYAMHAQRMQKAKRARSKPRRAAKVSSFVK